MRTHESTASSTLTVMLAVAAMLLLAAPAALAQVAPLVVEMGAPVGPSTPISGDGVEPTLYDAQINCQQLGYAYGFKVEGQGGAAYTGTFYLSSTYGTLTGGAPEDTVNHVDLVSDGTHLDWTSTLPMDLVFMKGGPGGNAYLYDPEDTADTGLGTPGSGPALSHVEFCYDYELVVSKTAAGSFDRVYDWSITKTADGDYDMNIGDPAVTHGYTVTVDRTVADRNYAVAGEITIANPSPLAATIASVVMSRPATEAAF